VTWQAVRAGLLEGIPEGDGPTTPLWDALAQPSPRLLYKHSPYCIVSMGARRRVLKLSRARPDLPIFQVDVIHDRATSQEAEAKFGIRHESPQAILFVGGVPVWHGSHGAVTVDAVLEHLDGAVAQEPDR
jgi:bacillithiol system protein YtxJ